MKTYLSQLKEFDECIISSNKRLVSAYNKIVKESALPDLDDDSLTEGTCPECGEDPCVCETANETTGESTEPFAFLKKYMTECGPEDGKDPEDSAEQLEEGKDDEQAKEGGESISEDVFPSDEVKAFFEESEETKVEENTDDAEGAKKALEDDASLLKEEDKDPVVKKSAREFLGVKESEGEEPTEEEPTETPAEDEPAEAPEDDAEGGESEEDEPTVGDVVGEEAEEDFLKEEETDEKGKLVSAKDIFGKTEVAENFEFGEEEKFYSDSEPAEEA